jgi:hypothetical protein
LQVIQPCTPQGTGFDVARKDAKEIVGRLRSRWLTACCVGRQVAVDKPP